MDTPDLDLVTTGVAGPLGTVADAVTLTSVLGVTCIVVRIVYSSSLVTIVRIFGSHRVQT